MPGFRVMGSTSSSERAQETERATSLHSQASGQKPSDVGRLSNTSSREDVVTAEIICNECSSQI